MCNALQVMGNTHGGLNFFDKMLSTFLYLYLYYNVLLVTHIEVSLLALRLPTTTVISRIMSVQNLGLGQLLTGSGMLRQ